MLQITVFMASFIALRPFPVKRSGALQHHMLNYWNIGHVFVMITLIWKHQTFGETRLCGDAQESLFPGAQ
ncbi:hypothetical protein ASG68_16985 [Rhizobium sp. Leaf453]|nr:hypothetical protein ASG50_05985 [Rhizobium sp. Leaf386]KQT06424.1 hypothetical protein ASG42_02230 [Rhizobium sp. Leaf391]KQT92495.1 hypothetical protein ASG68_16985 [Rhizobium sp. Leaf453]